MNEPYFMQRVCLLGAKDYIEKAIASLEKDLPGSAISLVRCAIEDLARTFEGLAKTRVYR